MQENHDLKYSCNFGTRKDSLEFSSVEEIYGKEAESYDPLNIRKSLWLIVQVIFLNLNFDIVKKFIIIIIIVLE